MTDVLIKFKVDGSEALGVLPKVEQGLDNVAASGQAAAISAKQYSAAMRGVPAQITDIVTSLQAGQSPLTVFLQQGGQLKDMFGGVAPAARALGSAAMGMVTPLNLGLAAVAAVGVAAYQGSQEQQTLSKALVETGNQAGKTAGQLADSARNISAVVGTQGQAVGVLAGLISAGAARAGNDIEGLAKSAIMLDKVGGASIEATTKRVQQLTGDPIGGLRKLSDETGRVTQAVYEQAQAYMRAGQNAQAVALVLKQLEAENNRQADALKNNLGYIDKAWMATANGLKGVWDWMKSIGRDDTLEQQIDRLEKRIKNFSPALTRQDKIDLEALKETQRLEKKAAAQEAEAAETNRRALEQAEAERSISSAVSQHKIALADLTDKKILSSIKDRLARSEMMEEDAIKQRAQIEAAALSRKAEAARAESGRGSDRVASQRATLQAAELEAQASAVLQNAQREVVQLRWQQKAAMDAYVQSKLKASAQLDDEAQAIRLQASLMQKQGVVIETVNTLLAEQEAARIKLGLATVVATKAEADALGLNEAQRAALQQTIDELTKLSAAQDAVAASSRNKDVAQAGLEQAKRLGGSATDDPFKQWGTGLRETFATAGDGLARMVDAMGTLAASSKQVSKEMEIIADLRASKDPKDIKTAAENEQALIKKTQATQVAAYASMAGSAKQYFGQSTAGYKALQAVEVTLRTYQLAQSAAAAYKDLEGIGEKVAAWVMGEETMTGASVIASGERAGAAMAEGEVTAAAGVANQAKGDPYTAFPRMAAMAAMMAALGFAVSRGGSGGTTYDGIASIKNNDGSGSGFGSNTASESMRKSLEYLRDVAKPELTYSAKMVSLLESIDSTLGGSTRSLIAGGFNAFGSDFQESKSASKGFLGLFGGSSSSTTLANRGLLFADQSVKDAMNGVMVEGFQTIKNEWSKSGFLGIGGGSGVSYSSSTFGVDAGVASGFTRALGQMVDATQVAAGQLGYVTSPEAINRILAMDTGFGKVDLLGKSAEEINTTLSAVFSKLGDRMASVLAPGLDAFQQSGEGYLQTVVRVGSGMEQAGAITDRLGVHLVALQSITNKTGDVAAEATRQSVSAYEAVYGTKGIAGIVDVLSGSAKDIADAYTQLVDVRTSLASFGVGGDSVTTSTLAGAGGADALSTGMKSFQDNFMTAAERSAVVQAQVADKFARVGVALPASADAFKNMVRSVDATTSAGQKQLGTLLSLSDSFNELVTAQKDAAQATQDAADAQRKSGQSIRNWLDGLDANTANPLENLATKRANYIQTLSLARAGDQASLDSITSKADSYLSASKANATSAQQYDAVVTQVKAEMSGLTAVKDYDQQMLDKLAAISDASSATAIATAATVQTTSATGQAATAGAQTTAAMNDQTMVAIAANTAHQLDYLAGIIANTKATADSLARIEKQPSSTVINASGGSGGGLLGTVIGGATSVVKSIGKVFGFAQGDVFAGQGVYSKPTAFNFSGSMAAIGEAGPEGVLPLERMPNGDLGVQAIFPPVDMSGDVKAWLQQIAADVRVGSAATAAATQDSGERLFDVMLAMQSRMGSMADDIKSQKDMLVQWEADGLPETRA
jgi:phage-related minor tail protein